MTKQDFVSEVAKRSGLSNKDAGKAVDAFLEAVTDTLRRRGDVTFTGFGKFSTADRAARAVLDDLGSATFRADLASLRHETQYTRLFRS